MIEDDIIVVAWVLSLLIGIGLLQEGNIIFGIILSRIFMMAMGAMSGYQLTYVFPTQKALMALIVAIVLSQLASILPAIRASRTKILDSIQYE